MKQYAALDDTVYFWFAANDTSGSGGDGASPAADVRLAGAAADAAPVYSPTPVLLSHASYPAGAYEIAIAATAANGFASNNTYAIFCTLAIDAQNPTGFVGSFDLKPIEANVTQLLDTPWLTPGVAGTPDVNAKLLGGTAQTGNDVGADVNDILMDTGTTLDALIKDVPTVAEFETRSILAADYVVVGDTIAGVTAVTNDVGITQAGADKVRASVCVTGDPANSIGKILYEIYTNRLTSTRAGYLDNLSAGAVALASGVDLTKIHGVALTETVNGYLAAGFIKLFDVATPLLVSSDAMRGTDSAALAASYTATRAGYLDNINNANLATIADISTLTATEIAYLNASISSRSSHAASAIWSVGTRALTDKAGFALSAAGILAIWHQLTANIVTANTIGKLLKDDINATISSRSSHAAADIWSVGTRALTDKAGFSLAAAGITAIWEKNISAFSGAGYAGTYVKTLYDDWINAGRLDAILDIIAADVVNIDGDAMRGTDGANTTTPPTVNAIADQVWDELLTAATHNIATSAGRRLRETAAYAISHGTAQAGATTTITLAADADGGNGIYNRNLIVIVGGTGAGQTRTIADYSNTTKVCIIDREWRINPDATSEYQILADDTPLVVDQGVAQAGTATTITLRDYASSINDTYLCNIIIIIGGTGRGQARLVGGYNGSTKVVTLCGDNWVTNPDNTSVYVMIPYGTTCTSCIGTYALSQINTECDTALADFGKTGYALSTAGIDAILDEVVEGTTTFRQMLRLFMAILANKSAGGGTVTLTCRDIADTKNRITATVDADGNRTAITVDGA